MTTFMMLNLWANPEQEDWRTKEDIRNDITKKIMLEVSNNIGLNKSVFVAFTLYGE